MKFQIALIVLFAIFSVKCSPVELDAITSQSDEQNEKLNQKLNKICSQMILSDDWDELSQKLKKVCLKSVFNELTQTEEPMSRERRFFSVGHGQINKQAGTGQKGFKYGK